LPRFFQYLVSGVICGFLRGTWPGGKTIQVELRGEGDEGEGWLHDDWSDRMGWADICIKMEAKVTYLLGQNLLVLRGR
jgi:hypothetical protein